MNMCSMVHLATQTAFSFRHGAIRHEELMEAVHHYGMPGVGIADRDGLGGIIRAAKAAQAYDIPLLPGVNMGLAGPFPGWGVAGALGAGQAHGEGQGHGGGQGRGQVMAGQAHGGGQGIGHDVARCIVLATTNAGYGAVCRAVSAAHGISRGLLVSGHDTQAPPCFTWDIITTHLAGQPGVHVLLGDSSPLRRLVHSGRMSEAEASLARWYEAFGERVYVGLTDWMRKEDAGVNRRLCELADRHHIPVMANQEPRYIHARDAARADVLQAIGQQVPVGSQQPLRTNTEGWFKPPMLMAVRFKERPDALANTVALAEQASVDFALGSHRVPAIEGVSTPMRLLTKRAESGLVARYRGRMAESQAWTRLENELSVVDAMGLAGYFLIVADIVQRIRDRHIVVACRGSAAGSLLVHCLAISDVDPLGHDLLFERFLNPARTDMPDIDLDVESHRRHEVLEDVMGMWGAHRVAGLAMVETFKARSAVRQAGKALGIGAAELGEIARSLPHIRAGEAQRYIQETSWMRHLGLQTGVLGLLLEVVTHMDGLPQQLALHPCGLIIGDDTLQDLAPMQPSAQSITMVPYDKDDIEALGLVKIDILGVRMLSTISHTISLVQQTRGEVIQEMVDEDPQTYAMIRRTDTIGMFQIESPGQRELIGRIGPTCLEDLIVDISLFRPGPVQADMITPYVAGRQAAQDDTYLPGEQGAGLPVFPQHPLVRAILAPTYGVMVFHEQSIRLIAAITGESFQEGERVRRALGDPAQHPALETWLRTWCGIRGMGEEESTWLWETLRTMAAFGFCKAHAAAFGVQTYRSAWLKAHYLPEFIAGLLTHSPGMYPDRVIITEARRHGVAILPLDINAARESARVVAIPAPLAYEALGVHIGQVPPGWIASDGVQAPIPPSTLDAGVAYNPDPSVVIDAPARPMVYPAYMDGYRWAVIPSLRHIKGMQAHMLDSITLGQPFVSLQDVAHRTTLSRPVAQHCASLGVFDSLMPEATRGELLLMVDELWRTGAPRGGSAQHTLFEDIDLIPSAPRTPSRHILPHVTLRQQLHAEVSLTGMDISAHLMEHYLLVFGERVTLAADLDQYPEGHRVFVGGVTVASQTPRIRSGKPIIFLTLDDGTGMIDATLFHTHHHHYAKVVFSSWMLLLEGTVRKRGALPTVSITKAWDMTTLRFAPHAIDALAHHKRLGSLISTLGTQSMPAPSDHRRLAPGDMPGEIATYYPPKIWHHSPGSVGR